MPVPTSAAPVPRGDMIVRSASPLNAEPVPSRLRAALLTPTDAFYVRCHGPVPAIDPAGWRLRVDGGAGGRSLLFTLDELARRLPVRTVRAVLQCAGNRRGDLQSVAPTTGDPWGPGAIGCADWTGTPLAALLDAAGVGADPGLHVAFDSADRCEVAGEPPFAFGVSIPIGKARDPDVLLAWAMNGAPLRAEHGAPLRAVVPGFAGVRSAKWLLAVTIRDRPSDNHMQRRDYRLLPPDVTADDVDWSTGLVIDAMPLNAAICTPEPGARVPAGTVAVRGYAVASERAVARVDVSGDDGATWTQAALERTPGARWAWTFWEAALVLAPGRHTLAVRAWDEAGQTQPASPAEVWNFKGYLSAAWHRVPVTAS